MIAAHILNGTDGSELVADTTVREGLFSAINFKTDTVFTTLTGNHVGGATPVVHLAGTWLYGRWTVVKAASGTFILYKAKPRR